MDGLVAAGETCLTMVPWVVGFGVVFALLARWMPCNPGKFWGNDRSAAATDLIYWFLIPLFVRWSKTGMLVLGVTYLFGGELPNSRTIGALPIWLQCVLVLVIQDVMLYGVHRVFHTRQAWAFHAIHHSPRVLDWASAARNHVVNHLFSFVLVDVVVLLMGFSAESLMILAPFSMIYSSMVHANLNWTFGPLRYVFASPVFHRWHHVSEGEGIDKNFASTFPVLDLLFGTFYMPEGVLPERFGNGDPDFPDDFVGQMIYPFVPRRRISVQDEGGCHDRVSSPAA